MSKSIGLCIVLVFNVYAARVLGAKEYGIYSYVLSISTILVLLPQLGFNSSVVRFASAYKAKKEYGKIKGLVKLSGKLIIPASMILSAAGVVVILFLQDRFEKKLYAALLLCMALIPLRVSLQIIQSFFRSFKLILYSTVPEQIIKPLLILVCAFLLNNISDIDSYKLLWVNISVTTITIAVFCYYLKIKIVDSIWDQAEVYETKEWIKVSIPMMFASIMQILLNRIDTLMLGAIKGMNDVGVYNTAMRVSDLNLFILAAVSQIIAPMISSLYAQGEIKKLQEILKFTIKIVFLFTLPISGIMIFKSEYILSIFGEEYLEGTRVLKCLAIGRLINSLVGPVGYMLIMTGLQNKHLKVIVVSVLVNILCNYYAIILYGPVGAAAVTSVTMCFWNVWMLLIVKKELNIESYLKINDLNSFALK